MIKVNGLLGIFVEFLFTHFCLSSILGLLVFSLYIMLFYIEILCFLVCISMFSTFLFNSDKVLLLFVSLFIFLKRERILDLISWAGREDLKRAGGGKTIVNTLKP